jgi:DNA-binding response OmpR family regulator
MGLTVLTIEDQPDIRRLIRMTLEYKGYTALEASTVEDGLALAQSSRPDLVLLDLLMPGIGGLSGAQRLRADPALRHIPIVMLSALGSASDMDAGLETGANAYLTKPFSPVALLELIGRLIAETPGRQPATA